MKNQLISYKLFSENKPSFLIENNQEMELEKNSQMSGLSECIEDGRIYVDTHKYYWDEIRRSIYFQTNVRIGMNFLGKSLEELPFKIGKVVGNFSSWAPTIESLKGGPITVKDFDFSNTSLSSLEGSPIEVIGSFNVSGNVLRSLKGCPKFIFGPHFNFGHNLLKNLDHGPLFIRDSITGNGNPMIMKEISKFFKMHEFIRNKYKSNNLLEIMRRINNDILDGSYATDILISDPYYSEFLGDFPDQIKEFAYLRDLKDSGII